VNFFGHAAAAQLVDDDPAFMLGAMAPDLLPLCGAVAERETSPKVAAGGAHHVAVDAQFHANPAFTAMQAWAARELIHAGVARGPARGAAHVGIELFLDGALAGEGRARAAYARSLADADTTDTPFVWRDEPSRARWGLLVERLRGGAIPERYRDCDFVADRLIGALARRPRLALGADEATVLRRFLPALATRVAAEARGLAGGILAL
jgi:acyl carrier protein phosphodiesterase